MDQMLGESRSHSSSERNRCSFDQVSSMTDGNSLSQPIRLVVQEPALPKYRVPFYRILASRPGIQLKVIYSDVPNLPNAEPEGFNAIHVPVWRKSVFDRPISWSNAHWAYASRAQSDVLVLGWDLNYFSLVPALLRARVSGVPVVLWGHGYSKNEAAWRHFLRCKVGKYGSAVLFYNYTIAREYIDRGWDPQRIYVALNSLDQGPIQNARSHWLQGDRLCAFRQEQGLGDGPIILFVSRLEADNRVDLLLQAAADLRRTYPTLKVIIIGKGPDQKRLEAIAEYHSLGSHVRFLGSIYDEMQLAPWFLSANVFCYPANIGLSILHAFGYGLPVVTSNRVESQNPEIEALRHGENGLLYANGDLAALIASLRQIIDDRESARRLSEGALETVTDRFNMGKMVDGCVAAVHYAHQQAHSNGGC